MGGRPPAPELSTRMVRPQLGRRKTAESPLEQQFVDSSIIQGAQSRIYGGLVASVCILTRP